ncbi:MAG: sugar O-acetyltransferase [Bacteroidales bacterium]|nr:sugar O-acetyltransferase [Bacteroidales bacterium]
MQSEKEKMLLGKPYDASNADLLEEMNRSRVLMRQYNQLQPNQTHEQKVLIQKILGKIGSNFEIVQPFYFDFGTHIEIGDHFFSNFNFTVLDEAKVIIGNNVFMGPNVNIYTAIHPIDPVERNSMIQTAQPVTIGNNVWIGGNVVILPGISIGNNVTIGAGSVVTKSIPDDCIAVGNPCRVIRHLHS